LGMLEFRVTACSISADPQLAEPMAINVDVQDENVGDAGPSQTLVAPEIVDLKDV
jgi:hypothetical protein